MSASLVGSEMCIRDSPPSPHAPHPPFTMVQRWMTAKWLLRWRRREEPVSYTHLTLPTICSV
eukprot:11965494-Alexandrium_andersonii.AAC.1